MFEALSIASVDPEMDEFREILARADCRMLYCYAPIFLRELQLTK